MAADLLNNDHTSIKPPTLAPASAPSDNLSVWPYLDLDPIISRINYRNVALKLAYRFNVS